MLGQREGVERLGVGRALEHLGRDQAFVRHDVAVLAVERDLLPVGRDPRVAPPAADAEVDLARRQLAAVRAPPALDQLGRRPRLVDEVPRRVELARDQNLVVGGERDLRLPAMRRRSHRLPPSA